jgi:hypothetical protein
MVAKLSKWIVLVALVSVFAFAAFARGSSKAPGTYEGWGPDIDHIEIVSSFRTADYSAIVVEPLDASSVPTPEEADMVKKVAKVSAGATTPFLTGMKKDAAGLTILDAVPAQTARTLILRTRLTTMDPGSRSKRMWIGYGAGAARTAIAAEIVDATTGAVLIRFQQERRSGIERLGRGSSYEEIMKRNLIALGKDVSDLLKEF